MSFFQKLFGKSPASKTPTASASGGKTLDLARVQRVVNDYGAALEKAAFLDDIRKLPYDKELIADCIKAFIVLQPDPSAREQLAGGYVMLSQFQDIAAHAARGTDAMAASLDEGRARSEEIRSFMRQIPARRN